jgi:uncharacterized protein YndB with AHSA1/START domain
MVPQRIEREILIAAPMDVVWSVITEPEHISGWFSDTVELDLRPGGKAVLHWEGRHTVRGRVERVEPPRLLSFRWEVGHSAETHEENWTLVEFTLDPEGSASTRLKVVESGFQDLVAPDDEKQRHFDGHRRGWELELGELEEYVRQRAER